MKRRWTAALLALALAAALLPGKARAAQAGSSAGSRLTGVDQAVYQVLRAEVEKIAAGARTDTAIQIPDQDSLSWTLDELGLSGKGSKDIQSRMSEKIKESLHVNTIFNALLADCPFEMFWQNNEFSCGYTSVRTDDRISIQNIVIQLYVAQAYQAGNSTTVSAAKVAAANQAAASARAIVEQYQGRSDREKLEAYRDEICQLVSYDMDTYVNNPPYGDPWQLVYVFDGDPATNVVCEGYAKAFKYLCDLSDFDGDVSCYIVSGYMNRGLHMWNVVRMGDGQNYLVDVTNSDSGMSGADGQLFLSGAAPSNGGQTYTISKGSFRGVYTYWPDQEDLFTDGYLALSGSDYTDPPAGSAPGPSQSQGPDAGPAFTDVPAGAYYADAVAWAVEQGITNGTSDTTFSPDKLCTGAEILTFLWRAADKPDGTYADSESGNFYDAALSWADSMGMPLPGSFDLGVPCTRSSAVSFIWWAFGKRAPDKRGGFTDVAEDAPYAEAVDWAVEREITNGTSDATFDPDGTCTRGQIVTFLYRAYSQRARAAG